MASFNKVILAGNLTREPELRTLQNGNYVCKIGLAVNRKWTNKDGSKGEETTFVDATLFGKGAETVAKYCAKGQGLLIEGRLKAEEWEDKQTGQRRSKLGVVVDSFTLLGGKGDSGESTPSQPRRPYPPRNDAPRREPAQTGFGLQSPPSYGEEEDVPF